MTASLCSRRDFIIATSAVSFEAVGEQTWVSIEHRAWGSIPQRHAARHGFPEHVTLQRAADWWRESLEGLRARLV